jgi:predicted CopG family antitoxin
MKRMNVTLDEEALEDARRLTGKKSYSDTINHLITQALKQDRLMKTIDDLANDPEPWWPGYVEEYGPNPPLTEADVNPSA